MPYSSDDDELQDDDSDDGYISCPHCGETMLEDAEYCPSCDRWMTSEDPPAKSRPVWLIVVVLVLVATIVISSLR